MSEDNKLIVRHIGNKFGQSMLFAGRIAELIKSHHTTLCIEVYPVSLIKDLEDKIRKLEDKLRKYEPDGLSGIAIDEAVE